MQKLAFLFLFLSFGFSAVQAQKTQATEKNLIKTLDPEGAENISFKFNFEELDLEPWEQGSLRIRLLVHSNYPESIMKELLKAGRYEMQGLLDGDTYYITMPNLDKMITVGNLLLEEQIFVSVQTPGYFQKEGKTIKKKLDPALVVNARGNQAALKKMRQIKEDIEDKVEVEFVWTGVNEQSSAKANMKERFKKKNEKTKSRVHGLSEEEPVGASRRGTMQPNMTAEEFKSQYGGIWILVEDELDYR
ncbi:hypothetical protein SapgrDRAFT_1817 [Saprospira grandis DSM 2844]|uniref:Uncharacterized protein n=1 Tax=Saprospira grandis DSM 2844 TaxID=694433 RepID=J1I448_9BACT|nr:hypothetical protein [Saprospira grandis]EJF53520.1 hypothetical protein SapgrDRAFT_1817 [Saprospira grandis DSM 2844]